MHNLGANVRSAIRTIALDLLAGFTAVCALIAATLAVVTRSSWDIRWFLILTAGFFFLAVDVSRGGDTIQGAQSFLKQQG